MGESVEKLNCIEGILNKSHPENFPAINNKVDQAMNLLADYFKLEEEREAEDRDES